jgi:hypothetical protein
MTAVTGMTIAKIRSVEPVRPTEELNIIRTRPRTKEPIPFGC